MRGVRYAATETYLRVGEGASTAAKFKKAAQMATAVVSSYKRTMSYASWE